MAWTSFDKVCRMIKFRYSGCCNDSSDKIKIHPTQKPHELYEWIFKNYSHPGGWIIDTHVGSQSSRIAAYNMGLNFIGFEIDKDYFEAGNKRFDWYVKQLKLW